MDISSDICTAGDFTRYRWVFQIHMGLLSQRPEDFLTYTYELFAINILDILSDTHEHMSDTQYTYIY